MICPIFVSDSLGKKAPAARLKLDTNDVHQISPDFTGIHEDSWEWNDLHLIYIYTCIDIHNVCLFSASEPIIMPPYLIRE